MDRYVETEQANRCQKLLAAVVAQAVRDATLSPLLCKKGANKDQLIYRNEALTGLDFLLHHGGWCFRFLDMDQDQFGTRLVNKMFDESDTAEFNLEQKVAFRLNYQEYMRRHQSGDIR